MFLTFWRAVAQVSFYVNVADSVAERSCLFVYLFKRTDVLRYMEVVLAELSQEDLCQLMATLTPS
jgi:hypothetical protein